MRAGLEMVEPLFMRYIVDRVLLDRALDIRISDAHHGPRGERKYRYVPTYMLRGLQQLHLEFTPTP